MLCKYMVNVKEYLKNLNKSALIMKCHGQQLKTTHYCLLLLNNNKKELKFILLDTTITTDM